LRVSTPGESLASLTSARHSFQAEVPRRVEDEPLLTEAPKADQSAPPPALARDVGKDTLPRMWSRGRYPLTVETLLLGAVCGAATAAIVLLIVGATSAPPRAAAPAARDLEGPSALWPVVVTPAAPSLSVSFRPLPPTLPRPANTHSAQDAGKPKKK
jgi:hypothetical protein